jgi:hypothetical protein
MLQVSLLEGQQNILELDLKSKKLENEYKITDSDKLILFLKSIFVDSLNSNNFTNN